MLISILQLIRFPNAFTAMSNVVVGYAVLVRLSDIQPNWADVGLAGLGAMMLYGFGMALNDIADRAIDNEIHPERPLPSGKLSLQQAKIVAVSLMFGGTICLGVASPALILLAALLAISIGLYDVILKSRPVAASVAMGTCRSLCVLLGTMLAASHAVNPEVIFNWTSAQLPLVYLLLITTITAVSHFEGADPKTGNFKPLIAVLALVFLSPLLVPSDSRLIVAAFGIILGGVVLRPGLAPKPIAGLVVRNVIFALPLFDALWCVALGLPTFALISVSCFLLVQISARGLAQTSA